MGEERGENQCEGEEELTGKEGRQWKEKRLSSQP